MFDIIEFLHQKPHTETVDKEALAQNIAKYGADAIPTLTENINNNDVSIKEIASMALARIDKSIALKPMAQLLKNARPEQQMVALNWFRENHHPQAIECVTKVIDTGDIEVRRLALTVLQETQTDEAISILTNRLNRYLDGTIEDLVLTADIVFLLEPYHEWESVQVALEHYHAVAPSVIIQRVYDEQWGNTFVQILKQYGTIESQNAMIGYLIGKVPQTVAQMKAKKWIEDALENNMPQAFIVATLARYKEIKVNEYLLFLEQDFGFVINCLGQIGTPQSVDVLMNLFTEEDDNQRRWIIGTQLAKHKAQPRVADMLSTFLQ